MRISFEMSGGFGGIFAREPLRLIVDTDTLEEAERNELTTLVSDCQVDLNADVPAVSRPLADAGSYRLTVSDVNLQVDRTYSDANVPPRVRPLLTYLQRRAIAERQK